MRYFEINKSPTIDKSFCFLWNPPPAVGIAFYRMAEGDPMGADYPQDVPWQMCREIPGKKLPSLIGTSCGYLVVARPLKEVFEQAGVPIECLPFTLLDHKKRVASRDYFIINPLGTFDCLDLQKSHITWSQKVPGAVLDLDKPVLDPKKIGHASDLFRILEDPTIIVLSAALAKKLQELQPPPTNVYLNELEIAQ